MRRFVARLLRRLANRLHPQREMRVRLTVDSEIFKVADVEERLRRTSQQIPSPPRGYLERPRRRS